MTVNHGGTDRLEAVNSASNRTPEAVNETTVIPVVIQLPQMGEVKTLLRARRLSKLYPSPHWRMGHRYARVGYRQLPQIEGVK